jgi:hypothetical protein
MKSRRSLVAVLAAVSCAVLVTGIPEARASTPYCGITWGSLDKVSGLYTDAPVVGARVGRHDCWDRLVIDLNGLPEAGYRVRYTDGFRALGSGTPLAISGGAVLTITADAPAYDTNGQRTVPWSVGTHIVSPSQFSAGGFRTFRDLVYGGSYEGQTTIGLGVRARLPFRVFSLTSPTRLVVDVAHQWQA